MGSIEFAAPSHRLVGRQVDGLLVRVSGLQGGSHAPNRRTGESALDVLGNGRVADVRAQPDNVGSPRCHSFVRDGGIQFLTDCEHGLAGQTVDLPAMPELPE